MLDACGRQINYLRVSVTDKCNLRCRYCMPHGVELIPMQDLLTMEEITRIVSCGVKLGIDRVKLTGKYSFQYITDSVFTNCELDTKDALANKGFGIFVSYTGTHIDILFFLVNFRFNQILQPQFISSYRSPFVQFKLFFMK
jgi:hypothetical protein